MLDRSAANVDRDSYVPLRGAHVGILYQMKVSGSDILVVPVSQVGERRESLGRTFVLLRVCALAVW